MRSLVLEGLAGSVTKRAESREPRAESREPRAESREPRAESREPRLYQPPSWRGSPPRPSPPSRATLLQSDTYAGAGHGVSGARVLPMRRLAGAGPAPAASGGNGTGGRAGALARSILWLSTGEPDAGCESRQSSESLQPAPCAPPAPGRNRPAGRPAALARAAASARHAAAAVLVVAAALFALAAPAQAQDTDPVWDTTMTVGATTGDTFGFSTAGFTSGGSLDRESFPVAGSTYTVTRLHVGTSVGGLVFRTDPLLPSRASYTLEFAGETLPLSVGNFFNFAWLAANAPSLSETNYRTTLAVDAMPSVCLRTAAQVCPGGTTTNAPPVFGEGATATRSVAENTAAGTDIGSPLTATDAENDSLEYQGKITKNLLGSMSYCESDVDFSDKAISIHRHAWG